MHARHVAGREQRHDRAWRENVDYRSFRPRASVPVARVGPCVKARTPNEPRRTVQHRVRAVRQIGQFGAVRPLRSPVEEPIAVQDCVDVVGSGRPAVAHAPERLEASVVCTAALRARAMPRRKRGRFVQEEELRPRVRLHQLPAPPWHVEPARDPAPHLPRTNDTARVVVQNSTVAGEKAATRQRRDLREWSDAVLERHVAAQSGASRRARTARARSACHATGSRGR